MGPKSFRDEGPEKFSHPIAECQILWLQSYFIHVLLVFSVTPFKKDQNKNQNRSIN